MTSSADDQSALRVVVRGRVQGVGFRYFAEEQAAALGLTGLARNLSNGSAVEVVAEGTLVALETLLSALRQGPPLARVERVDVSWAAATGDYSSFSVR
jgi:acylphosphatase